MDTTVYKGEKAEVEVSVHSVHTHQENDTHGLHNLKNKETAREVNSGDVSAKPGKVGNSGDEVQHSPKKKLLVFEEEVNGGNFFPKWKSVCRLPNAVSEGIAGVVAMLEMQVLNSH